MTPFVSSALACTKLKTRRKTFLIGDGSGRETYKATSQGSFDIFPPNHTVHYLYTCIYLPNESFTKYTIYKRNSCHFWLSIIFLMTYIEPCLNFIHMLYVRLVRIFLS